MKFRTEIELKNALQLQPQDGIVAIGSCFAERIGELFKKQGLDILVNPFGVVYNPISLATQINSSLNGVHHDNLWEKLEDKYVNMMYHGVMSGEDLEEVKSKAEVSSENFKNRLVSAKLLIVTLGTSFGYEEIASKQIVTNCHRFPAERFHRRVLTQEEMFSAWQELLQNLQKINPTLKIIFTVSPVRYVRDSLVENQLSKSMLHVLVHSLVKFSENFHYFPSYEIMMDDLRDYRFYEEDLVQPNVQALKYILEKFEIFSFSAELKTYWKDAEEMNKLCGHTVSGQDESSNQFIKIRQKRVEEFQKKYPFSRITTIISR